MKVEIVNGTRKYGDNVVFEGVDLTIPSGSLVAVLGDNGQGKSTLIECIYGLQKMNQGDLLWDGKPFDRHDVALRQRAFYMPDLPPIETRKNGLVQISKWFDIWGLEGDDAERAVDKCLDLLERFNVLQQAGILMSALSRGERYKVALAGFLSLDADLWLLDEPLASGMDSRGIEFFKSCCREAVERGKTVIYTTQLEELAHSFSTHICRVEGVKVELENTEKGVEK